MSTRQLLGGEAKPVIESMLMKRDTKSGRSWKKRYVVLFPDCIKYYKKKGDSAARGTMPLSAEHYVSDISNTSEKQRNTFVVSDFLTSFHLAADSSELRDFWMHAIARIIRNLQQKENWYGEASGVNRARTDSEIERDYEERLANYKQSQGLRPDTATSPEEEDAIVAQIAAEEARRDNAAAEAEANAARLRADRAQLKQARLDLLERKRRDAEARLKAAEAAEQKALERAKKAAAAAASALEESHAKQRAARELEAAKAQEKAKADREREAQAEAKAAAAAREASLAAKSPKRPSKAEQPPRAEWEEQQGLLSRMMKRVSLPKAATAAAPTAAAPAAPAAAAGPKPAGRGIAARLMQWQEKVETHQGTQSQNVFSGAHAGTAKLSKDDPNYGKAVAGSQTEARAIAAKEWVDKEIDKLCDVIRSKGSPGDDGKIAISFGELFLLYQNISDSLVGILMRAKKRKRIMYTGDMLFQGMHDDVQIQLL